MTIDTPRLILRDFVEEDWRAVLAYQSHPLYLRYNHWETRSEAEVREFLAMFLGQQHQHPRIRFQLAATLRSDGRLIGNAGVRMPYADARQGEIGYEFAPEHWGQGYATEAAGAMLRYGFEVLRLHRVQANCVAENVASARVLEKLGMQREGRLRENEWFKGRWWDTLLYAILDREWRARQGESA